MGFLVGFHAEGWDFLVLKSFIAVLLGVEEDEIVADWIERSGRSWQFVIQNAPAAMERFYSRCAQFAVFGIDNDGNDDLTHTGTQEDRNRPRHWNHSTSHADCRFCQIQEIIARERLRLSALARKPPHTWPVLIAVPVETIEAWLLELQAIVNPASGVARAENRGRAGFKVRLYGNAFAAKQDVERIALPLIRSATQDMVTQLRQRSRSFALFADQVDANRSHILGPRDCWGPDDGGAER